MSSGCRTIPPWTITPRTIPPPVLGRTFPPDNSPLICYAYIYTHVCIHTHTHTYIHTHIHIHTYIHTYIYMHTYTCVHIHNNNNNNFRVSNIRVSNRTLIYNVCPEAALT